MLPGVLGNNNLINRHSVAGRTRTVARTIARTVGSEDNNLINRYSVAGSTRTVARTVGSDQGQYLVLGKMGGKRGRVERTVASAGKGGRQESSRENPSRNIILQERLITRQIT